MKNRDLGLLILRLTIGLLMIPHGLNKVIHPVAFDFIKETVEAKGLPIFIAYGVFIGEIVALFFLGTLALFFTGAGKYSLSHRNTWD